MFASVLGVTGILFAIGALLVLLQRSAQEVRTRTGWAKYATYSLFVVAMLTFADAGSVVLAVVICTMLAAALTEFARAAHLTPRGVGGLVGAGLATGVVALAGGAPALYASAVALSLASFGVGALAPDPRAGTAGATWSVVGLLVVAVPGAHLLLLVHEPDRFALFAFLFLVVCGADAFAELIGRKWPIGRGFLAASPHKTLSGVVGGLLCALVIGSVVNAVVHEFDNGIALLFALVVAGAAMLGDLIASALKRLIGVKDFATWIPGHGGVLDRVDSLFFAAPPFYWLVRG